MVEFFKILLAVEAGIGIILIGRVALMCIVDSISDILSTTEEERKEDEN